MDSWGWPQAKCGCVCYMCAGRTRSLVCGHVRCVCSCVQADNNVALANALILMHFRCGPKLAARLT